MTVRVLEAGAEVVAAGKLTIQMPWGRVELDTNEMSLLSTVPDPPKLRVASIEGLSLGAVSAGRVRDDGRQIEMALLQFKQDERTRNDPASTMCEATLHLNDGSGEHDGAMRRVFEFRHDGATFWVPVRPVGGVVL
ncbi:MAG: hypothetical protein AB7Q16_21235 [Vicinamibacterales bacterium]